MLSVLCVQDREARGPQRVWFRLRPKAALSALLLDTTPALSHVALARVRVSAQDSESPVDLLQQKRPRPIVRQRHSRKG